MNVGGFADDLVGLANVGAVGVVEAGFDEADGEMGDVDANPAAVEFLRDLNGGAAAAEGVEDYVAFGRGDSEDALEQGFWLLGRIAEALLSLGVDGRNVPPKGSSPFPRAGRQGNASGVFVHLVWMGIPNDPRRRNAPFAPAS